MTDVRRGGTSLWRAVGCLVALPALLSAQSLGDVARKERVRREKLKHSGTVARTFTEQDLATTKGTLANDPKQEQSTQADEAQPSNAGNQLVGWGAPFGGSERPSADGQAPPGPPPTAKDYWQARVADARDRVAQAQRRYDMLQRWIAIGQPEQHDANGRVVIYSPMQLKAMADAAETELASAKTALEGLLEEARRAGALPGWFR